MIGKRFAGFIFPVFLVFAVCLVSGCVSGGASSKKALGATTLMVARGDGEATLQWKSDPQILYTVMYAPRRSSGVQWTAHPQFQRIRGTGQTITIEDRLPRGKSRHYRLYMEPIR